MFRLSAKWANITSLRPSGATSLCGAQHHGGRAAASLYKADVFAFTYAPRLMSLEVVVVGDPPPQPKRKVAQGAAFLFGTMCSLRERDAHCVRDASFGRDVRLRRVNWNTSHHCERSEQHHCAERHNITCPRGQASLYKADVFCYTWFERRCEYV